MLMVINIQSSGSKHLEQKILSGRLCLTVFCRLL